MEDGDEDWHLSALSAYVAGYKSKIRNKENTKKTMEKTYK